MRTTIELPDELLKGAKMVALQQGTTLRALVARAIEREIGTAGAPAVRLSFPLLKSKEPGALRLNNADIEAFEVNSDAARDSKPVRRERPARSSARAPRS